MKYKKCTTFESGAFYFAVNFDERRTERTINIYCVMKLFDRFFRWLFGLKDITSCYCGQWNDKSKNEYCTNCGEPLK